MFKGMCITKRERITAGTMSPTLDGGFIEIEFTGFAWRCDGCGLVWSRQHQAVNCAQRNHVPQYESQLYGVRRVENGVPVGYLHTFTRHALRKEGTK